MKNELIDIAKKLNGKILLIGFSEDDKVYKTIDKNSKKYSLFSHLTNKHKKTKGKKKFLGNKTINIKKLYKGLKKEKYDYLVCEFEIVKPFLHSFIKNSYKLTTKKIYFYVNDEYFDYEELMKRYSRYKAKCTSKGSNDEYLITIEVETMKYNSFKAFFYSFRDLGYNIANFIANVIIS